MINSRPTFPIFRYNIGGRFFDRIFNYKARICYIFCIYISCPRYTIGKCKKKKAKSVVILQTFKLQETPEILFFFFCFLIFGKDALLQHSYKREIQLNDSTSYSLKVTSLKLNSCRVKFICNRLEDTDEQHRDDVLLMILVMKVEDRTPY